MHNSKKMKDTLKKGKVSSNWLSSEAVNMHALGRIDI